MGETFEITFEGIDELTDTIEAIKEGLDDLESEADPEEGTYAQIIIRADAVIPELEAIMWEVLKKIQIRAAENEAEFLLGI